MVGSVDKKISGDVDSCVDWKDVLKFSKQTELVFGMLWINT